MITPLDLSGPIDERTPITVLEELLDSYGVSVSTPLDSSVVPKVIRTIRGLPQPTITKECRDNRLIARLVNPRVTWTATSLRKAFKFLLKPRIERDFHPGRQTPKDPKGINARIIYRECRRLGIDCLSPNTSLEEMATALRLAMFPPPDLCLYLSGRIGELPLAQLIELTLKVGVPREERGQVTYPITDTEPQSPEQAIAITAYHYSVDISESLCPLLAHSLVKDSPELFQSADTSQHPEKYPCLNYHFNPRLPIGYYSNNTLFNLMLQEGLTASSREDSYRRLSEIARSVTFRLTGSATTTLIYAQDVAELGFGQVVFLADSAFSLIELRDHFRSCCNLINPLSTSQELLTPAQVARLKALCRSFPSPEATELLQQIEHNELVLSNSSRQHADFIKDIQQLGYREPIIAIFEALHTLAMYMRGWDGRGPLPITQAPVDNQVEVDVRVTQAIADLDAKLHSLPQSLRSRVLELNLYCQREDGLRVMTPQDTVPTLGLRLELVRGGSDLETIESCIRVSSNYFAATSHYYLMSFGKKLPYNLATLRYIS